MFKRMNPEVYFFTSMLLAQIQNVIVSVFGNIKIQ